MFRKGKNKVKCELNFRIDEYIMKDAFNAKDLLLDKSTFLMKIVMCIVHFLKVLSNPIYLKV